MALESVIKEIKRIGLKDGLVAIFLIVATFAVMSFWSELSRDIYLADAMDSFRMGAIVGLSSATIITLLAVLCFPRRLTLRQLPKLFGSTAFLIGILSIQLPSALVRYLPHKRIQYLTEYDISFPGPSRGKSGHCEMGLWLKDRHLNRWIQFCSSRAWLKANCERGKDRIEVVEDVNRYGVKIVNYWCAWSPIKK